MAFFTQRLICLLGLCLVSILSKHCFSSNHIETIDFDRFITGNKAVKDEIAKQFDSSMINTGFIYIINHDVNMHKVQLMYNATKQFFHSSSEEKEQYIVDCQFQSLDGYMPYGKTQLDSSYTGADLVESYEIGNKGYDWYLSKPSWSQLPTQFISDDGTNLFKEYIHELRSLLYKLHILATYALDMKINYFEQFMIEDIINNDYPYYVVRLNYYFEINNTTNLSLDELNAARLGAHTDFHGFTILYVDGVEGLQANINNEWSDILPPKNGFIVNAGDLIPLWTSNRWKPAIHRVMRNTNKEKISIGYFSGPIHNLTIETFPDCSLCRKTHLEYIQHKLESAKYGNKNSASDCQHN